MAIPSSPVIRGNNNVFWGTNGIYAGRIVSCDKTADGDMVEIKDNDGYVTTRVYFNHNNEANFEMIAPASIPDFNKGDLITIGTDVNCEIQNAKTLWKQDDVARIQIKAKKYAR